MHKVIALALTSLFAVFFPLAAHASVLVAADSHASILSSNSQGMSIGFNLSDTDRETITSNSKLLERYIEEGEGFTLEFGRPKLPTVTRIFVVDPDVGLELEVQSGESRRVKAENPPLLCDEDDVNTDIEYETVSVGDLYPSVIAEMSEPFVMRGVRMVRVTSYPVQYDAENQEYIYNDNIVTNIRYTNDAPVNPGGRQALRNRSAQFLKFIRTFAMNGDIVGRDDPDRDREPEYVGHYLVVVHQNCLEYAEPFIEWRRKSGWKVELLRIPSNISSNPNTIKGLIRERWDGYLEQGIDPFDHLLIIGDHSTYDNLSPSAGWVIQTDRGNSIWPSNANHNDWWYACLDDGNDAYADVAIARWVAGSSETMNIFVHRTLSYEVTPYMENTEWYTRGATYAQRWAGNYHESLATNVRWGRQVLESLGFDDILVEENMDTHDSGGSIVGPAITEAFNAQTNVMIGRAENYNWRNDIHGMQRNEVYPIDLCIGGHHEWTAWNMLRIPQTNSPMGPVAASTGWGGQQTLPYSVIWLEAVNGFLQHDLTWGWAHIKGVLAPEGYIPNFGQTYVHCKTDVVFYGDPAIQYWQGVPQIVEADYPEFIAVKDRLVEVSVYDPEGEQGENAVEGAQVTLYFPRDMPDPDDEAYAEYDEMFMMTKMSDAEGIARFILPEDAEIEPGVLYTTITGRNILPVLGEMEIVDPDAGVELTGWTLTQVEGNDDDEINPGEEFTLNLTARNISEESALEDVTATVSIMSEYIGLNENTVISFGQINAGEEADGEEGISILVSALCPDAASRPATTPSLRIVFSSGEASWETAIDLDPVAPDFVVHNVIGGNTIADGMDNVNIEIENIGRKTSTAMHATLVTLGMGVSVIEGESVYASLDPGRTAHLDGDGFQIAGNRVVVPGSVYDMVIVFENEAGFVDSAFFQLQVSEPRENAPQGPDGYGYICFDDTDTDWDMAPELDWLEISLEDNDRDFDGTLIGFDGSSPHNIGETIVVDLPFETQFYGHLFDKISVATNGFISMGDQAYVTNYQNWPMDRAIGGGVGMLAPLWDDLRITGDAGVYFYHDEEDSRFVIEWYKMRHRTGGNSDLTFQVILYDHDVWITETGDQNIMFQYKEVSDVAGRNNNWQNAVPYASVGISAVDGTTGLNYSFNDHGPVTSAPLENGRVLLFSTSPRYKAGDLFGRITAHPNDIPVEGAIVTTQHGFTAISDENGDWRINDALAEIEFDITCLKQGFNDSTHYDMFVAEDEELEINFNLLHPEFTPSTRLLEHMLDPDLETEMNFTLTNTGNGPLTWDVERRLLGDANAAPWEFRRTYMFGDTLQDSRVQGVVFAHDHFYVAGANDGFPHIYKFDRDGVLADSFAQGVVEDRRGMRDLAWDGELLWGAVANEIFGFTLEGEVVHQWQSMYNPTVAITYDPDREVLWLSSTTTNPVAYTRDGEAVEGMVLDRFDLRIYGMAYWVDDPDNYPLYIFHKDRETGEQQVHKFNPDTGDSIGVATLIPDLGGDPAGAFITNQFDVYSWVMITVSSAPAIDGGDRIDIWQLEARRDWFQLDIIEAEERIEAQSGVMQTGEEREFILTLNSTGLPDTLFQGEMLFRHDADSGYGHIYVDLDVIGAMPPFAFGLLEPADGDTLDSLDVSFIWNESIDPNFLDEVVYELFVASVNDTVSFVMDDTLFSVDLDTVDWVFDPGMAFTWWVRGESGEDKVLCDAPFIFRLRPPNVINDPFAGVPVEFTIRSVHPNPFNAMTTIAFGVDRSERTILRAYDISGREVARLYDGIPEVGFHRLQWSAIDLPSGIYMLRLDSGGRVKIAKTALLK